MKRRGFYQLHRWLGILSSLFVCLVALTAIALNRADLWRGWFLSGQSHQAFSVAQARQLAADPHDPKHLLAADPQALYQSFDGGQRWQELKLYVPAEKVAGIGFDPAQAGAIWVALRDAGLFFSDDGGEIWEEDFSLPFEPFKGEAIEALLVSQGPTLSLRTALGWYRKDATGNWTQTPLVGNPETVLSLHDWIWRLHTGRFAGLWGPLFYDAIALSLILLALTGLRLSWRPRRKRPEEPSTRSAARSGHDALAR